MRPGSAGGHPVHTARQLQRPSVDPDSPRAPECVFCQIIAGKAPAEIIAETEAAITIVPLNPVTERHWLVIPRQHAERLWDLETRHLAHTMFDVAGAAWAASDAADGCNVIQSNGSAASQTIGHVHFHIVPRREGDGLTLPWTNPKADHLELVIADADRFLKARRQDGIDFPYDSRPLRKLREIAG